MRQGSAPAALHANRNQESSIVLTASASPLFATAARLTFRPILSTGRHRSGVRSALLGLTLLLSLFAGAGVCQAQTFQWKQDDKTGIAVLQRGDKPVLQYMYAYDPSTPERLTETYKVFHHLFSHDGKTRLTKGPGGLYPHHRGLYVAWNKTGFEGTSADFWHCTNGAHQKHARFVTLEGNAEHGWMTSEIHWNDKTGQPVIVETRTIDIREYPVPDSKLEPGWQIDWQTKLESKRGPITLDGDRQHAGFQYRADQPVADAKSARYIRPPGFPTDPNAVNVDEKKQPPEHIDLGWLCMSYELNGQTYHVQYCESPKLPKPSRYSERDYGRFGAFFQTTLQPDQPLIMVYRLYVTTGPAPSRERLQTQYDQFVAGLKSAK